jgi:peptidoglycan/LPS O-acetylase OafA/YrhL
VVLAGMRDMMPRDRVSSLGKLPLLLLFIALSLFLASLVSRYFSEPVNDALRRRFLGGFGEAGDKATTALPIEIGKNP